MISALWQQLKRYRRPNGVALAAAAGVLGMLLILLSELWPTGAVQSTQQPADSDMAACEAALEQRLQALIGQLAGAGEAVVMVTLESGAQTVYALDSTSAPNGVEYRHVLLESGGALQQTTARPAVCGVAVVCDGGGDIHVAAQITQMLSALLDLPTNRISVHSRQQ